MLMVVIPFSDGLLALAQRPVRKESRGDTKALLISDLSLRFEISLRAKRS